MRHEPDTTPRSKIPADVDTPDKIVYGLTARQLAILTVAAVIEYGIFKAVGQLLPQPVLIAVMIPVAGAAIVLALGRRDGLSLDVWLLAGIRQVRSPQRLVPAPDGKLTAAPAWAPQAAPSALTSPLGVLRLPARAISEGGVIDTSSQAVALVACTTVNINLRTGDEQAALIGGYGRWLNSLSSPVQVVISAQRVDLSGHAQRIAEGADTIANAALAEAARDYADFLDDLAIRRDPLWRTVTVAVTAAGDRAQHEAARRAEHAASALSALGVQTAVLDGGRVTAVLATAVDPYTPADASWPRTRPDAVIHHRGPS
jgi:PrgI family protein